jgi:hypothetical protein
MSEYQYYEFRAIDSPLSEEEIDELSALSTRAEITATSFVNTYNYGDFKGNPRTLMERYFDAFVYVSNWGTYQLMFRVPRRFLDIEAASAYSTEESLSIEAKQEYVVIEFLLDKEDGGGGEWVQGEPWMPSLILLRDGLMRGDYRALYLGWLASLCWCDPEDANDELEPPVPPGLAKLSAPLKALGEFLEIPGELIEAAAAGSLGDPPAEPTRAELSAWIKRLPAADKEAYLLRFLAEEGDHLLRAEISKRFREATLPKNARPASSGTRRTVSQLLKGRDVLVEARDRKAAEKAAEDKARREREKAAERNKHLDNLAGREEATWREVNKLIALKQASPYDRAVELLGDLRDLAARSGRVEETRARIQELRRLHASKPSLIKRFNDKKLGQ